MKKINFATLMMVMIIAPAFSQDTTKLLVRSQGIEVPAKNPGFVPAGSATFRLRCVATIIAEEPLFVVDGIVVTATDLKNLDPNKIASITVLKDIMAKTLFSCRGERGVVIICTKNLACKTLFIKDKISNQILPGATVDFILQDRFKADTIRVISDSAGRVVTEKLRNNCQYQLNISNVGYKSYSYSGFFVNDKQPQTIFLDRDLVNMGEVVVISSSHRRGCRLSCVCYAIRVQSDIQKAEEKKQVLNKIYPNPALRSQELTVAFSLAKQGDVILRMVSADGKTIFEKKHSANEGVNQIKVTPDGSVASGIYVVQIIDKDKKLISRHKLVLQ